MKTSPVMSRTSTLSRFPLGKTGGLIEAIGDVRSQRAVIPFRFPLGKTGGLIEANLKCGQSAHLRDC